LVSDLVDLYDKLYRSNIGLDGSNIRDKRSTAFFSTAGDIDEEHHAYLRIITLRRTLQVCAIHRLQWIRTRRV